ncbi:MAG: 30S ribosomal protein S2 [Candidatus Micrarchaeota archaeon]|nr:30S ribosomal protein S2 [Candidatus Micrarchaeota archaeon]
MLTEKTDYLTAGVHIGMKSCTKFMKQFVYKTREDGLSVFNVQKVDERIATAAKFLAGFEKIMAVSRKGNGKAAVSKFIEVVGGKAITGRFPPGTLTNPSFKDFYEPDVLLVVDPLVDRQAVKEAVKKRVPIVALCDTFNEVKNIDLAIPLNNNGRKSLALVFMLLAREILKHRAKIEANDDFEYEIKDFGGL